ncbi:MAG: AAA family ATPase [Caldilineaceae bacterium]
MRIERFQIQGFKSIADVTVEGLADINVFFGLNDVGKSNIFQALELWYWLITAGATASRRGVRPVKYEIPSANLQARFGSSLLRIGHENHISITAELIGHRSDQILIKSDQRLVVGIIVKLFDNEVKCELTYEFQQKGIPLETQMPFEQLASSLAQFHVVHAARRLQSEHRSNKKQGDLISDSNLKQALFYAYLSSDLKQKQRLNAIKRILAEPPYNLGELDVALDPQTDRIDIGFVRASGRLPIENLGSGSQQLLLVLGQIFLNDCPIIAFEEPEMNLSPQSQEYLMLALRKLMQDPAIQLQQLFISTHSPYLEFAENFYDVTFDAVAGTQVVRSTQEKHRQHFSVTPIGPDTGARLNSQNQVKLYDGVVQDLALQRGDLVIFVRNDAGHWEIRAAKELAQELQAVTNGQG